MGWGHRRRAGYNRVFHISIKVIYLKIEGIDDGSIYYNRRCGGRSAGLAAGKVQPPPSAGL